MWVLLWLTIILYIHLSDSPIWRQQFALSPKFSEGSKKRCFCFVLLFQFVAHFFGVIKIGVTIPSSFHAGC